MQLRASRPTETSGEPAVNCVWSNERWRRTKQGDGRRGTAGRRRQLFRRRIAGQKHQQQLNAHLHGYEMGSNQGRNSSAAPHCCRATPLGRLKQRFSAADWWRRNPTREVPRWIAPELRQCHQFFR